MPDFVNNYTALPTVLIWAAFGYLLGSIPFGLLITRFAGQGDIREIGSGNIGATNVLRTGNKKLAALTLLADALKGTFAVWIAFYFAGQDFAVIAGLGAFLGHLFPVWLKFNGGKGVATYIGILGGLFFPALLIFAVVWLAVAFLSRYSSLAALLATLATPFVLRYFEAFQFSELFMLLTLLTWIKHHENIKRLFKGTESKIGKKG
ncbi:MAG: glycerol-3-phosphate 1-O-acyltransferase PlsY [Hyphomicrobiales bacterium]